MKTIKESAILAAVVVVFFCALGYVQTHVAGMLDVANKWVAPQTFVAINGVVRVDANATGGSGTSGSPWTGWESSVTAVPCGGTAHFGAGYYTTASTFNFPNSCSNQVTVEGEGIENTFVTFTGSATPALSWQGSTNGGGLKDINIKINNAAVDAVNMNGIAQFIMRNVLLTGPYTGTGNAVGCSADNGKGCGLHITAGTVAGHFEKITSLEFEGDGINIDSETSGSNVFRTVIGQGDGGWNWNIHRVDNNASGGPIYCFDCEGLGIPNVPTSGAFTITSGVLLTTQSFGFWCFECIADGENTPSTAVGMNLQLVSMVFLSNNWIKALSTGGSALVVAGVQNVFVSGGFIQNSATTVAPISLGSGTSNFRVTGAYISAMGTQPAVHYSGGGFGSFNSLGGALITPGTAALTDDFANATLAGFTGAAGSTVGRLPSCTAGVFGSITSITDNNAACAYGGTPTAGGSTACMVYCDGTSWKIH